ncbi:MAG: hypothetical protein IJF94_04105 [Eubacterium sp.]|nr:hypothetical protein [Eubacterium sp.]
MSKNANDVIDQLAEIDSQSSRIIQQTQEKKNAYFDEINQKKHTYDQQSKERIAKEVGEYKASVNAENEKVLDEFSERCKSQIEKMNKDYEEKSDEWAEHIFNRIIRE